MNLTSSKIHNFSFAIGPPVEQPYIKQMNCPEATDVNRFSIVISTSEGLYLNCFCVEKKLGDNCRD